MAKTKNTPPTTRETVSKAKEEAEKTVKSSGPSNTSTGQIGNAPSEPQNQDKDTVNLDDMSDEKLEVFLDEKERLGNLTDDERERKKKLEEAKKNAAANAGKIEKPFRDPEWPDREKSKFDIQQGDFIEFLMKDVVLAAAAEAGDKVFGGIGTLGYRGGSWIYHGIFDRDKSSEADKKKKEAKEKAQKEALKKAMVFDDPNDYKIKDDDDQTTVMTKKIRQFRMNMIPYNEISYHEKEIKSLIDKALSKDWNPENLTDDEKALLKKYGPKMKPQLEKLHQIALSKNFDEKFVENVGEKTAYLIGEHIRFTESVNVVAANYAAAALMNAMAKDPEKYKNMSDAKLEKLYQIYALQGKKVCLTEIQNIFQNKPDRTFEDFSQMLTASGKAFEEARDNMKNNRYKEKDGQPITENQQQMEKIWEKINNRDEWSDKKESAKQKDLQTMQEEAFKMRDEYLQRQLEDVARQQAGLSQQERERAERASGNTKNKPEHNKPDNNKEKPTKTLGQNRSGKSY